MAALDLEEVRRLATSCGLREAYFNATSRVVSFAKPKETIHRVRFNVYYTTGTVGTCLNHPTQGRTQLFRRNVDIHGLKTIFENPRVHTGEGYHRTPQGAATKATNLNQIPKNGSASTKSRFQIRDRVYVKGYTNGYVASKIFDDNTVCIEFDNGSTYVMDADLLEDVMEEVKDEESAATNQKKALEEELTELEKRVKEVKNQITEVENVLAERLREQEEQEEQEKKGLQDATREMERRAEVLAKRQREERQETERMVKQKRLENDAEQERLMQLSIEVNRDLRGRNRTFSLAEADHVSKCFAADVTCVSCCDNATIMLYEGGGWSWTSGIPTQLHNKLNGRQKSLPKPVYVSIGSENRYYIEFADGKSQFLGCNRMMDELQNEFKDRSIASIAFGQDWDSYFIVFTDGWYSNNYIPAGLSDLLTRRRGRADLKCVSLGPNGEYFLQAKNERIWYGGLGQQAINEINDSRLAKRICYMDFGADYSYFIRYR